MVWDLFMTDSAKYADILLPDLMATEQPAMVTSEYAGNMAYGIMNNACTNPKFERKTLYASLSDIADKMGKKDEFTEGKDEMAWMKEIYEAAREEDSSMPEFDQMMEQAIFKSKDPDGQHVALSDFRKDPEANPLKTPSGKIEIYSQALADYVSDWEIAEGDLISPLPVYCPGVEGYDDPMAATYPLQMIGYHQKGHVHSSYANIDVLAQASPNELWINPVDADARNIKEGDIVRVFNDRGVLEIPANVTPRILPGVVSMPQGAWHDADMASEEKAGQGFLHQHADLFASFAFG